MLQDGGGLIIEGTSLPPDLPAGLEAFLHRGDPTLVVRRSEPGGATNPVRAVGELFDIDTPDLSGLISCSDHVAIVDLSRTAPAQRPAWITLLRRIIAAQSGRISCFSTFLLLPQAPDGADGLPSIEWGNRLGRLDLAIWADLHAPLNRPEPLSSLGEALAVEVGNPNLDLVAAIASASTENLLDIRSLLEEWRSFNTVLFQDEDMFEQRVWRAQLRSLFPWIEELRQNVLARHRGKLIVNDYQRALGVVAVDDLELGAIEYQLRRKVPHREAEFFRALAQLRNDLAHRKPIKSDDLKIALNGQESFVVTTRSS